MSVLRDFELPCFAPPPFFWKKSQTFGPKNNFGANFDRKFQQNYLQFRRNCLSKFRLWAFFGKLTWSGLIAKTRVCVRIYRRWVFSTVLSTKLRIWSPKSQIKIPKNRGFDPLLGRIFRPWDANFVALRANLSTWGRSLDPWASQVPKYLPEGRKSCQEVERFAPKAENSHPKVLPGGRKI